VRSIDLQTGEKEMMTIRPDRRLAGLARRFGIFESSAPRIDCNASQFDAGRWKLRLELAPMPADKRFFGPLVSGVAIGVTVASSLIFVIAAYLWAQM
jgi:hypothetical protein